MDIAGLDVLAHVMRNLTSGCRTSTDRAAFAMPPFLQHDARQGLLGEKTGKGFYERRKSAAGESEIWTLDLETLDYRPKQSARIASIEAGKSMDDVPERVRMLFARERQGRRSSCARRWRRRSSTRRASRRTSRTPSTTSIA